METLRLVSNILIAIPVVFTGLYIVVKVLTASRKWRRF